MISFSSSAIARKPAVEDFVGIETEHFDKTPPGTEVVFEFGNMVKAKTSTQATSQSTSVSNYLPGLTIFGFLALPFLLWFGITKRTQGIVHSQEEEEFTPNVTNLDDFRKTDQDEEVKKAS
jgi:beta-lactamase regulating signal transducer with metallopeptidase domain